MNYRPDLPLTYADLCKIAAAILTPEAEQAAVQPPPPMDPGMGMAPGQGMPPAAPGAAPMGGAPQPPMQAAGPQGGDIPPEILQDQAFLQFLSDVMGIMFDPNSGTFVDPNGQPIPAEMIVQAYQEFQMQMSQQGGGQQMDPSMMGGAPADPTAAQQGMPMDPMAAQGAPMDPMAAQGMPQMDPMAAQGAPMDPMTAQGMPDMGAGMDPMTQQAPEEMDPINDIASAVMSGVEAIIQEQNAIQEKKLSTIIDKLEALTKAVDALQSTTDRRDQYDKDEDAKLREEIAADLQPVKVAAKRQAPKLDLFSAIQGNRK